MTLETAGNNCLFCAYFNRTERKDGIIVVQCDREDCAYKSCGIGIVIAHWVEEEAKEVFVKELTAEVRE